MLRKANRSHKICLPCKTRGQEEELIKTDGAMQQTRLIISRDIALCISVGFQAFSKSLKGYNVF